MALANDLMGFGMPAALARTIAEGGTGPLTAASAGSSFATATRLKSGQSLVSCSDSNATTGIALPAVGADTGALLCDIVIINNGNSTSLPVFASTSVTIVAGTAAHSVLTVLAFTSAILYPISTSSWVGIKG